MRRIIHNFIINFYFIYLFFVCRKIKIKISLADDYIFATGNVETARADVDLRILLEHYVRRTVHAVLGRSDPFVQRPSRCCLGHGNMLFPCNPLTFQQSMGAV